VLPTIEGDVLCGDKGCCDGPLKKRLAAAILLLALNP
jgi:hypothetical protein